MHSKLIITQVWHAHHKIGEENVSSYIIASTMTLVVSEEYCYIFRSVIYLTVLGKYYLCQYYTRTAYAIGFSRVLATQTPSESNATPHTTSK